MATDNVEGMTIDSVEVCVCGDSVEGMMTMWMGRAWPGPVRLKPFLPPLFSFLFPSPLVLLPLAFPLSFVPSF